MASATAVSRESPFPSSRLPRIQCNPLLSSLVFFASDTAAIAVTGALVLLAGRGIRDLHRYIGLWPAFGLFFGVFAYSNIYPGIIHNGVAEFRRLAVGLTSCFLVVAGMILVTRNGYPRSVLFLWWLAAMIATPLLRSVVRGFVCHKPWWGIPIAVFYTGDESTAIIRELQTHPEIGLRPVSLLSYPLALR